MRLLHDVITIAKFICSFIFYSQIEKMWKKGEVIRHNYSHLKPCLRVKKTGRERDRERESISSGPEKGKGRLRNRREILLREIASEGKNSL